jgi:hypothetical protein
MYSKVYFSVTEFTYQLGLLPVEEVNLMLRPREENEIQVLRHRLHYQRTGIQKKERIH